MQSLSALSSQVEQCTQTLTDSLGQLKANEAESSDAIEQIHHMIARATDELKEGFESWATNVQKNCATLCADIQQVASDNLSTVRKFDHPASCVTSQLILFNRPSRR
jgi:ABC-type transporter Mla subunit MlaD